MFTSPTLWGTSIDPSSFIIDPSSIIIDPSSTIGKPCLRFYCNSRVPPPIISLLTFAVTVRNIWTNFLMVGTFYKGMRGWSLICKGWTFHKGRSTWISDWRGWGLVTTVGTLRSIIGNGRNISPGWERLHLGWFIRVGTFHKGRSTCI